MPRRLPHAEFIAMIAMNFAIVAFSIDAMLPALPEIANEVSPDDPNLAQLVLTSFVIGLGIGTLFTGPLSDRFGRKKVIACGAMLYLFGAGLAYFATDLNNLLLARVLQGIGAAAPRIVSIAIVRDLYEGRRMASILSWAMMVFTLVPAMAPLIGAEIMKFTGWRGIFLAFVFFMVIVLAWLLIRQDETLANENRRAFRATQLWKATQECFSHSSFRISCATQILSYGMLFGCLSSSQQIFEFGFDRAESFPKWFALIALIAGTSSILNARLVMRFGMRQMAGIGFAGQTIISAGVVALWLSSGALPFSFFLFWFTSLFFMAGLVIGNLNALAMEPLGHIAGLAASVIGCVATVCGVLVAIPIGLAFDGTPLPLALGTFALSAIGVLLLRRIQIDRGMPQEL